MTRADLGFSKKPLLDEVWVSGFPLTPPLIDHLLDHPLDTAETSHALAARLSGAHRQAAWRDLVRLGVATMSWPPLSDVDLPPAPLDPMTQERLNTLPPKARDAIATLLRELTSARHDTVKALEGLTPDERKLVELDQEESSSTAQLVQAWQRVDAGLLFGAAARAADAVQTARNALLAIPTRAWPDGDPRANVFGTSGDVIMTFLSPIGTVVIGGAGPTTYTAAQGLIIDVGGDDLYHGACGASSSALPVSVVMDLRGHDRYLSTGSRTQGAGILGVGILADHDGDDRYQAGAYAQGFGRFGVGLLWNGKGRDQYVGDTQTQGAATFGMGFLLDDDGADTYQAAQMSQAYAFVQGFGVLSDLTGNDHYAAGGVYDHKPLLPDRYRSLSQGCAFGERFNYGGGVAVLVDAAGSDVYAGDVFSQGVGYWLALGILADLAGHDTYSLTIYGQGSGIHSGIGALLDLKGEDSYLAAHGVTQGAGHDYAVGCLVDLGGGDRYVGPGFSQGAADEMSVGFLFDKSGGDHYSASRHDSQGYATGARGSCSVGLCLDLDGAGDVFSVKPDAPLTHQFKGEWGLLVDWREPPAPAVTGQAAPKPAAPDLPMPSDMPRDPEKLFELASMWQVGSNAPYVEGSRKRLIEGGDATLKFIIPGKLTIGDPSKIGSRAIYHMRALRSVLSGIGIAKAVPLLLPYIDDPDPKIRRTTIELLSGFRAPEAAAPVLKRLALEEGPLAMLCIRAFGPLNATLAIPTLIEKLGQVKTEEEQLAIIGTLGALKAHAAIPALARLLERELITVRYMAVNAMVACGDAAFPTVRQLLASPSTQLKVHGLELAAKLKAPELAGDAQSLLDDPDWAVRGWAVRALGLLKPANLSERLTALRQHERHPFVVSQIAAALKTP